MQEQAQPAPEERLETWREEMHPVLARLQDFELPADFPFDFSAASLARLESIALNSVPPRVGAGEPVNDFLESATAYVGEALLRAGGGGWDWDAEADLPLVRPDEALKLPSISPLHLIIEAVRSGTGTRLTDAHAALVAAVEEHRNRHPGWSPVKERTPAVDDAFDPDLVMLPWLENWLAEREQAFPAWVADSGAAPGAWDFSPASLATLEALVRRRLPTVDALTEPANHDFVQGAAWYYGEVARRNKPAAQWQYYQAEPGSSDPARSPELNPWVGQPFIQQRMRNGNATVPVFELQFTIEEDTPGFLAERLTMLPD